MRKQFIDTRHGQIHLVTSGQNVTSDALPVMLLHQTPRSIDEFRDVIPQLAQRRPVVAVDTLGFGFSDVPQQPWTIELFADGVEDVLDALGLPSVAIVGHHTGGVIGMEVAARRPQQVSALVLSGVPYVDAPRRAKVDRRDPIDGVIISDDGSHYQLLWNKRQAFYPTDRPDLRHRLMIDAVRVHDRVEEGHLAVNAYRMEDRISHVTCPTLITCGELDYFSMPDVPRLAKHLADAHTAILSNVGVASVDHDPSQFAAMVEGFLATVATTH